MKELLLIIVSSALVNSVILSQPLGLCPFLSVSKRVEIFVGIRTAAIFVIATVSAMTSLIYGRTLSKDGILGIDLTFLQTIVFILAIATLVQFMEMFLKKSMPALCEALGVYLPLITTNCVVLGVVLTDIQKEYGSMTNVVNGSKTTVSFTIAIIVSASTRKQIRGDDVPYNFQGSPIVLITSRLMATAFFGFPGLI